MDSTSVLPTEFRELASGKSSSILAKAARRLLETVDPDEDFEQAAESWLRTEVAAAYDEIKADPSIGISSEQVRAEFEARWAARS